MIREGYWVVGGTVDFCVDDGLNKVYCVIGNTVDLWTERKDKVYLCKAYLDD